MKVLRWLGKTFGSVLFTTFLVLAIFLMGLVNFSSYENAKATASPILKEQITSSISEDELTILHAALVQQCSTTDEVNLPLGDLNATLDCNDIVNSDASQLPDLAVNIVVESFYYKDYSCSFIDCLKSPNQEDKLIAVSNEGNAFYKTWQMYSWVLSGVGLVILLVSVETWVGRLKSVGLNLVLTGLPFIALQSIQSMITPSVAPEVEAVIKPIIGELFSSITTKFMIVLVAGIILFIIGYGLGFYLSRKWRRK